MSRAGNSLTTSDVVTTPIKLKYTSSYNYESLGAYGMEVVTGINGPVTITGSVSQETLNYYSIRHLFYSNFLTGSFPVSASGAENYLQSTAASGSFDSDNRYFPTQSEARITILSIPRGVFGEQISRKGFILSSSAYYIVDDGNGNVIDQAAGNVHIGNIIYPQGIVVFTNANYLDILEPGCALAGTLVVVPPDFTTTSTTSTTTTGAPTTTSTTTSTTTAEPTTTTSTTTTTTTAAPTTTSTTTTTTTAAPTTTTTTTTTTSTTTTTTTAAPTTTTSTTTTTTTMAVTMYTGCGRGNVESTACNDTVNNRTFYSDCTAVSFNTGCTVYTDTIGTTLTGYSFVFINSALWDINPVTGVITGLSAIQC